MQNRLRSLKWKTLVLTNLSCERPRGPFYSHFCNIGKVGHSLYYRYNAKQGKIGKMEDLLPTMCSAILRSAWVEPDAMVRSIMWQPLLTFLKGLSCFSRRFAFC
jgi:hypothetical protein